mmetsp:Transcript_15219/g.17935  ORF Transcript_15219/g.17935 Transcript_15219/m.17935 type:complete len:130 (-) Transcript_15219:934-1323(-)
MTGVVNPDLLLKRISDAADERIQVCIHGTYFAAWKTIQQQGLSRMKRNHIHFASGLPEDDQVISGMRKSCQIYIFIDLPKAFSLGIKFFRSDNGVILSPGIEPQGSIPPTCFSKVIEARTGRIVFPQQL